MANTMAERTNITAEELFWMGPGSRELVRGKVIEMTPGGADHGEIGVRIAAEVLMHARHHDLGRVYGSDTGFTLFRGPDTVRAPDVAFVRKARAGRTRKYFEGSPDLAVEVLSPSDRASELRERLRDYFAAGTLLVWVLDPATRTATVHRPNGSSQEIGPEGGLDGEDLLPGLRIDLAPLFAD